MSKKSILNSWIVDSVLPVEIYDSQAIVTNSRVYLLGGVINGIASKAVHTALINADGTLDNWIDDTPLPVDLIESHVITTKNRVYLLGGVTDDEHSSMVYTAPIDDLGLIGEWVTGEELPFTLYGSQVVVVKNRAYILGGVIDSKFSSAIYTAPINEDGTLGEWVYDTKLPCALSYSQAIVTNSRVYLLGGTIAGIPDASVYSAAIKEDGTLGVWISDIPLPKAIFNSHVIMTDDQVYLIGGRVIDTYSSGVCTATIDANGVLGMWVYSDPLPASVIYSQAILTTSRVSLGSPTKRVYMLGGFVNCIPSNVVYASLILTNSMSGTTSTIDIISTANQETEILTKQDIEICQLKKEIADLKAEIIDIKATLDVLKSKPDSNIFSIFNA